MIHLSFHEGALRGIFAQYVYNTESLDVSFLERIDKEETEKIIRSLIDYVRNGHAIKEPTLFDRKIVLMNDGRYAIRYEIDIQLDTPTGAWADRITACIYLE